MSDVLAIFARFPRCGQVKTRLAAEIGEEPALRLYEAFLLDTIDRVATLPGRVFLYLADSTEEENRILDRSHGLSRTLSIRRQSGRDLGERLWNACLDLTPKSSRVVFIGADSPTLPLSFIARAFRSLEEHAVVLGPVADGGYYLVGVSEPVPEIFRDISWGTSRVLIQTRRRLVGRTFCELPRWYDVDTVEDLETLQADLRVCDPPLPRTSGLLAAWGWPGTGPRGSQMRKVAASGPEIRSSRPEPEGGD